MPDAWRSLRARVLVMTACVACASVGAVGWYASRVGAGALRRQLAPTPRAELEAVAARAGAAFARERDWGGAAAVLADAAGRTGKQLVVLDGAGRAVAAAPRALLALGLELAPDGALTWQQRARVASSGTGREPVLVRRQRVVMAGVPRAAVRDSAGAVLGTLLEIPVQIDVGGDGPAVATLRRSLLVGVAVAVGGALVVALLLSARVARPIERLTMAVREVAARGDPAAAPPTAPLAAGGTAEVAELSRAFDAMVAALARAESLRRGMTSDVAHELRTPVTNIRCHIESMQDGLEEPTAETLASLHEEALALQRLIDDLQDLALGDQGRLELDLAPADVDAELAAALRPFRPRAAAAGVALCLRAGGGRGGPKALVDRRRFRQIVSNLVSNALTHTPPGGAVEVSAGRERPSVVTVRVRDTGRGIDPRDLPNVFERFYRADPARSRAGGGTGLGLAIVKRLVALHGGEAWLESEPGRGTTAAFTVPEAARGVGDGQ